MSYTQLLLVSFFINGLTLTGLKALGGMKTPAAIPMALLCMYGLSSIPALVHAASARQPIRAKSVLIGVMGGFGSAVGTAAMALAAKSVKGYIVFPVTSGGPLVLIALIGAYAFREKTGPFGIAGVICGTAAVALLSG